MRRDTAGFWEKYMEGFSQIPPRIQKNTVWQQELRVPSSVDSSVAAAAQVAFTSIAEASFNASLDATHAGKPTTLKKDIELSIYRTSTEES